MILFRDHMRRKLLWSLRPRQQPADPPKNPFIGKLGQVLKTACCPATRAMELRQEMIYLEPSRVRFKRQEI